MIALDLEQWRLEMSLTYEQFSDLIGVAGPEEAKRLAMGETALKPEDLLRIMDLSRNQICPVQIQRRRVAWKQKNGFWRIHLFNEYNSDEERSMPQ